MTVLQLIRFALKQIKVVAQDDDIHANDANTAREVLNMLIGQWNLQGLTLYAKTNSLFDLVSGQSEYTIGITTPVSDFEVVRPTKILTAFTRSITNPTYSIDYPCEIVPTAKYWEGVAAKDSSGTYPQYLYYNPTFPAGTITLWPTPIDTDHQLGLSVVQQLTKYAALTDELELPDGYDMALGYALAVAVAPMFGFDDTRTLDQKARESMAILKRNNQEFPLAQIDSALLGMSRGRFNIIDGF